MKTLDELTFKALEYAYNQGHIDKVRNDQDLGLDPTGRA